MVALQNANPNLNAVLVVGSDDIIEEGYLKYCRDAIQVNGSLLVGIRDMYYMDLKTLQLVYMQGYTAEALKRRPDATLGFGRCISSTILWEVNPPFQPWIPHEVTQQILRAEIIQVFGMVYKLVLATL